MSDQSASPETTFGYLAMLEFPDHGYFGGYLIVSALGRPLEFHCTTPIRPSPAQKILYGATLEPYLLGEQLSSALLQVAKLTPDLILVNHDATLRARSGSSVPMVHLYGNTVGSPDATPQSESAIKDTDASTTFRESSSPSDRRHGTFTVSSHNFQLLSGHEPEQLEIVRLLTELARHVELAEPFARIEEAIREAQRLGGTGADAHDQAA